MNSRLLLKLQDTDKEKDLLQQIVEQQDIQNSIRSNEITRLSRRAAELQKRVVKEKCKRETLVTEMTYSNPSKLMNYMRAQKAKGNSSFRSMAEYTSHVDAYARTSTSVAREEDEQEEKRLKYAKLIANKRLNNSNIKHT